jgi:lipopolysaccharide export system protein LptA
MNQTAISSVLLALSYVLFWGQTQALATDKEQQIQLEADRVDIDDAKGVSTYQGNVVLIQGSLHVWCDAMTIYSSSQAANKIVATGNPARFRQKPEDKDEIQGEALKIVYFTNEEKVHLLQEAQLTQNADVFRSQRIELDLLRDTITAGRTKDTPGRVHITLQPRDK